MADSIRKASFRCPECGYVQLEPAGLISTYCRSCGSHYEVGAVVSEGKADPAPTPSRPGLSGGKTVHCYRCGGSHEVSSWARSTICPSCSTGIDFGNVVVSANASFPVDTRGDLHIERAGYLNHPFIVCRNAVIEGKINGTLRCEGSARIASMGAFACRIAAREVEVVKRADVTLRFTVTADHVLVAGILRADITCAGALVIKKGGHVEGHVTARSLVVDKGGALIGESCIRPDVSLTPRESSAPRKGETNEVGPFLPPLTHPQASPGGA